MRTLFYVLLTLLVPGVARADLKLGYVDLQRALQEVSEGRDAKARLKTELDKGKTELEAEQRKLRDDKLVLDKQGSMMSEEVRTQKMTEWQQRLVAAGQKAEKKQGELADRERAEMRKIFDKMDPIIAAIAQRDGLSMVFEKTDSGLVYAPSSMDLTAELVRTYNDKFPVKGMKPLPPQAPIAPALSPAPAAAKEKETPKQ
jgi:outer membrane protein